MDVNGKSLEGKYVLVTGAVDFPGRVILRLLIERGARLYLLCCAEDRPAIFALVNKLKRMFSDNFEVTVDGGEDVKHGCRKMGERRIELVWGDVTAAGVGLDSKKVDKISSEITHIINCPKLRLLDRESYHSDIDSIVKGTDQLISLAHRFNRLEMFCHISSCFLSGTYPGKFYEDWLDVGQQFYDMLSRAHFVAETKIRNSFRSIPASVFRCGYLIGEAKRGKMLDGWGLHPFFKTVVKYSRLIPKPLPLFLPDSDEKFLPFSPVDYVAEAAIELMVKGSSASKTFCLVDPSPPSLREFVDLISDLMERNCYRVPIEIFYKMPMFDPIYVLEVGEFLYRKFKRSLLPVSIILQRAGYDTRNTIEALRGSGVSCPSFKVYVEKLFRHFIVRYGQSF